MVVGEAPPQDREDDREGRSSRAGRPVLASIGFLAPAPGLHGPVGRILGLPRPPQRPRLQGHASLDATDHHGADHRHAGGERPILKLPCLLHLEVRAGNQRCRERGKPAQRDMIRGGRGFRGLRG